MLRQKMADEQNKDTVALCDAAQMAWSKFAAKMEIAVKLPRGVLGLRDLSLLLIVAVLVG